ncbi:twin-arginine translocation protein, TatB subunit [Pseudoxanthomonas suwonensis 11-1]|uniref:Sec-independent protein translocase protein TatB n=1 Tax=Pseudoxanthomonas suwonensis (strain 11-1) TaxID=743721 RepID=E6WX83_PSEUU|nr:Sec-independent protein translocase protein TatB [Pseudoxanthomonas suwonensis]ADV28782.1 twin-arginine translocation protein, TatB subunit [Pseudoxanthomonas suwonensis 11-1]
MFDIGFGELLLIAVVALVVLGPERLPKAARFAGLWVRRARAQWYSVRAELERELEAEELKRNLQQAKAELQQAEAALRQGADAARGSLDELRREVESTRSSDEPMAADVDSPALAAPEAATDAGVPAPGATAPANPANPAEPAKERDEPRHS